MALTEKLTSIADAIRAQSGKADKLTLAQMPNEIAGLQGLNFTVVGGAAAPASPAENTIWVNTTAAITSWIFSASQPESPTTGMVWILTGISSAAEFNALKKNSIQVCPLSAKQYVGGAWVEREAKSYQGGGWVDWVTYLCNYGDLQENFTGSLATKLVQYNSSLPGTMEPEITYNADNVHILQPGYGYGAVAHFANKIDLSKFHTLHFDGMLYDSQKDNGQRCFLGIWSQIGAYKDTNRVAYIAGDHVDSLKTLDISALNDSYYIGFFVWTNESGDPSYVTMRNLWLE